MNRGSIITVLAILVHNENMTLAAAEFYSRALDNMLEDGIPANSVASVLEAINE